HFPDLGKQCLDFRCLVLLSLGEFGIGDLGIWRRVESGDFVADSFLRSAERRQHGDELRHATRPKALLHGVLGRVRLFGDRLEMRPVGARREAATATASSSTAAAARRYEQHKRYHWNPPDTHDAGL